MTEIFDSEKVNEWHRRVEDLKQQAETIFQSHREQIDEFADSMAHRWKPEDGAMSVDPQERHYLKKVHARRVNQMDRDLREQSAETIKLLIREATEIRANGDEQLKHYEPDQWLARRTVASEKRTRYAQTLAAVNPRELEVYVTQAKATGDFDLAAAVLSRASQFERKLLPFNVHEFISALPYPDDFTVARGRLESSGRDVAMLLLQLTRFQSIGKPELSPSEKIARGLARHRAKKKPLRPQFLGIKDWVKLTPRLEV